MKKGVLAVIASLVVLLTLSGCFLIPQAPTEYETGYYVVFNFQFKKGDNPDLKEGQILLNEKLKMTQTESGEYVLEIKKSDLKDFIEGHDKNGIYWWNVVNVNNPTDTSRWVVYGGRCDMCPSIPFLKEDFDSLDDDATVIFYADIPDATDTIVGFGDNLKDGKDFYFAGQPNSWTHQKMTYMGNGKYEIEIDGYYESFEYKIWPADSWDIGEPLVALAFNGVHYYATGENGVLDLGGKKKVKVIFDLHHSKVYYETLDEITTTIGDVKEILLSDTSTQVYVKVSGVVSYVKSNGSWAMFQDETDGIKLYDPEKRLEELLNVGDEIIVEGTALVYRETSPEIELATLTVNSTGNELIPFDVTGTQVTMKDYGRFVSFTGTLDHMDEHGNAVFNSDGATIVVSDYYSGDIDWMVGAEYTVKGFVDYYYGYKVYPRTSDDVQSALSLTIDGKLSDWESVDATTIEDATNDSRWGESNDFNFLKIYNDDDYLYVAGKVIVNNNGFMVVFDAGKETQGATDLDKMDAWARLVKLEGFENEFFIAGGNWGAPFVQVWILRSATDAEEITNQCVRIYNGEYFEVAIPWDSVGGKPSGLKAAAFVVGGDHASAPDTIPDVEYPEGWDWNVYLTIDQYIDYSVR